MPTPTMPEIAAIPLGTTIPKIIHQAYPTKNLPDELRVLVETLREKNPTWEYRLNDHADIAAWIGENYGPAMLHYYNRIDERYGAARIDFWRYLVIYKLGGVYIDIKSTFSKPLDDVIHDDDQYLLSSWSQEAFANGYGDHAKLGHRRRGEYQQWHVIGAPGHPYLRAVIMQVIENIDRYNPWRDGAAKWAVIHTTGPIAYTLTIEKIQNDFPHREVDNESQLGLVYNAVVGGYYQKYLPKHYINLKIPLIKPNSIVHYLYYFRILVKKIYTLIKR